MTGLPRTSYEVDITIGPDRQRNAKTATIWVGHNGKITPHCHTTSNSQGSRRSAGQHTEPNDFGFYYRLGLIIA